MLRTLRLSPLLVLVFATACLDDGTSGDTDDGNATNTMTNADPDTGSADTAGGDPENTDAACMDGVDNDGDMFTDCDDFDCTMAPDVTVCGNSTMSDTSNDTSAVDEDSDATCADGVDNDQDSYMDCDDFSCSMNPDVTVCGGNSLGGTENDDAQCMDGMDNDDDDAIDCLDLDCVMAEAATSCNGPEDSDDACANGWDDDDDSFIDCDDFDCDGTAACPSENTDELCDDGVDNDMDDFVDCDDFDCSMNMNVTVCP
jgi:hypothetical protein